MRFLIRILSRMPFSFQLFPFNCPFTTIPLVFAVADLSEKTKKRAVIWKEFPVVLSAVAASTLFFPETKAESQSCVLVRCKKKLHVRKNSHTFVGL